MERFKRVAVVGLVALVGVAALLSPSGAPAASAERQPQQAGEVAIINRFDTTEPLIALTFDAGADVGYTGEILDTLAREGIKATFGMTGVWAERHPDLIQRIHTEGHQLINHSWDHPSFPSLTTRQRVEQVERTDALLVELTGESTLPYFRPPFGEYDAATLDDLSALGYTTFVMWTVDTLGWAGASAAEINQRVLAGAAPGAIMLMHVGAQSQDAAALPEMIAQLRARGYGFATAGELAEGTLTYEQYFPETGLWARDNFLRYWHAYGGLSIFGLPISEEFEEDGRTVQYFERARFELHPDAWPEQFDVLLGRLAVELVGERIERGEEPFEPVQGGDQAGCDYFAATGHWLCAGFRDYWAANGGLAIFGYPISEEFDERNPDTGKIHTVQYFERARFEYHPDNAGTPYEVLLGRLGAQVLAL